MDLAVGQSAGTSSPRPSGAVNDEVKKSGAAELSSTVCSRGRTRRMSRRSCMRCYFEKGLGLDVGEEDLDTG